MTNDDELLKRLDDHLETYGGRIPPSMIKDIKALSLRFLKCKSELEFYRGFHDGVCKTGTHVVVPLEPTEAMEKAGASVCCGHTECLDVWDQMIKAAQEGGNG